MPTTFPLSTYPLDSTTGLEDEHTVERDLMDDGEMAVRVLGASTYRIFTCVFTPMSVQTAKTFADYLRTNRATEFDIITAYTSPVTTYRGYIWSNIEEDNTEGNLSVFSFAFRGKKL